MSLRFLLFSCTVNSPQIQLIMFTAPVSVNSVFVPSGPAVCTVPAVCGEKPTPSASCGSVSRPLCSSVWSNRSWPSSPLSCRPTANTKTETSSKWLKVYQLATIDNKCNNYGGIVAYSAILKTPTVIRTLLIIRLI